MTIVLLVDVDERADKVGAGGPFSARSVVCPYVVSEDSVEQVPAVGVKREGVEINKLNDLRFVLIFTHVGFSPFPVRRRGRFDVAVGRTSSWFCPQPYVMTTRLLNVAFCGAAERAPRDGHEGGTVQLDHPQAAVFVVVMREVDLFRGEGAVGVEVSHAAQRRDELRL